MKSKSVSRASRPAVSAVAVVEIFTDAGYYEVDGSTTQLTKRKVSNLQISDIWKLAWQDFAAKVEAKVLRPKPQALVRVPRVKGAVGKVDHDPR